MAVIKLGILVPSSNTAMEPIICQMLSDINHETEHLRITAHFSRIRVKRISHEASDASQFDLETMLTAASLLADAKVQAIGWGGTSAGWLGLNSDMKLCESITERFGVPAFTSTLSLIGALQTLNMKRIGLVTPYTTDMNQSIVRNFASASIDTVTGYECLALTDNIDIGNTTEPQLREITTKVFETDESLKAATTFCTNLRSGQWAAAWEDELSKSLGRDVLIIDSVSVLMWSMLKVVGETSFAKDQLSKKWGKLFAVFGASHQASR